MHCLDANNHITNFGFDDRGQSTSRTLPSGAIERFEYDPRGRQYLHVSFEGVHKVTLYDDTPTGGGRMVGYNLFSNQADFQSFQAGGTLAAQVQWEQVRNSYDAQGRMIKTDHIYAAGASGGQPATIRITDSWTRAYDSQGRLTEQSSPTGLIGYQYDDLGRKSSVTAYFRDAGGSVQSSPTSVVTYTYDSLGRLSTVNTTLRDGSAVDSDPIQPGNQPESTSYFYDLLGRPDYTVMPGGIVEDFSFDNMDRLDLMRHFASDSDNSNLSDNALKDIFDYSYRADGKRTGMVEKFGGSGIGFQPASAITDAVLTNNYTWTYDDAGRLVSEVLDSSDNSVDQTESFLMDLVGNRLRRTTDKQGSANDTTDIYTYDSADRLQTENRYAGIHATGTPPVASQRTTDYSWTGTQQTTKTVSVPSVSSVVQSMSFGLNGQLEKIITTSSDGSGQVQSRQQVEYRYDNSGIRFIAIDTSDSNLATPAVEGSATARTEFLVDHLNLTGYAQTLIEQQYESDGQGGLRLAKRISYTFGSDEITQTTSLIDPSSQLITQSSTLTFGHDGHGSVRVLFEAAAIAQVFTYSAYGELLSIHNGSGTLTPNTSALTSLLYNGESLNSRTGLYNFRARWYAASIGRFADRLDPYAGNPNDPFSFNKYGAFHANPVMGNAVAD